MTPASKEDSLLSPEPVGNLSSAQQQSPPLLVSPDSAIVDTPHPLILSSCTDVPDTHDVNELQQQLLLPPPLIPSSAANFFVLHSNYL